MNTPALGPEAGWAVLGGFSILWLYLGWWWGRGRHTRADHALAGRNIGVALGTATAMATWVTSNTTMAAPQLAYQLGVWGMLGYALGAVGLMCFAPMAERIHQLMPDGYTSGDFVRARFGRGCWAVFLLISLAYGLGWLVSMGMAGGVLLHALTGIDYRVGMLTIIAVCTLYTVMGGLHAVVGTDFIQSVVILVGLVALAAFTFTRIPPTEVHVELVESRPALLDLTQPAALMFLFNNLLFGMGEIFHSNVWWSRALAFRRGTGFRSYMIAGIAWLPVPIVAGAVALAAPVLGINVPALDMVGPLVAADLLGSTGAVMTLIVVFCSLASSLDSLLAATSDLLVQDVYYALLRPRAGDDELRQATRATCIGLSLATVAACWTKLTTLAEMIQFTGPFVASTIWPIVAGLYWTRANPRAATVAMLVGTAGGLTAYFTVGFFAAALVGATLSMICVLVGRWLRPRRFDWSEFQRGARAAEDGG